MSRFSMSIGSTACTEIRKLSLMVLPKLQCASWALCAALICAMKVFPQTRCPGSSGKIRIFRNLVDHIVDVSKSGVLEEISVQDITQHQFVGVLVLQFLGKIVEVASQSQEKS